MPLASGMASQIGIASETQYGTAVTVTRFYPLVSENVMSERGRLESEGIIAGARMRRTGQWAPGTQNVGGDVQLELPQQFGGLLWEHMLGTITSSATAGIATHTVTPGDLTSKSFTTQIGRPDVAGTVHPFTYAGCKIQEWEIACTVDEIATLGLTLLGQSETTDTSLASATYGTDAQTPYHFVHGSLSIAGSDVDVRGVTLTGGNSLADDRWRLGTDTRNEPLEADLRPITGTITAEFNTLDQYNRYRDGTEFAIVLSFSASTSAQAVVTMNARYDGQVPAVDGRGLVVVESPFMLIGDGSDADAITAVITNSQTSP